MRPLLRCLLLLFLSIAVQAEVIDRIVAVVEGHIITLSDLRQERDILTKFGEPVREDKVLTRELIDNYLMERQIDSAGIEVSDAEVDAGLQKSVSLEGPPSKALRDAVRRRIRMQKFVDIRFRQLIRPTDDDVRKYYDDVFVPEARARGLNPVPQLDQVADLVRSNVIQESLNHEIEVWLEGIRQRSSIEIFE